MIITVQPEDHQCCLWCRWEIKYRIGYQVYFSCPKCKCRKVKTVNKLDKENMRLNWLTGPKKEKK